MLALAGLPSQQTLRSRKAPAIITLLVKLPKNGNKHKLSCYKICSNLPPHTHDEQFTRNEILQHPLRAHFSQALLDRERDFKRIYYSTFERCREQTAHCHAHRNKFKQVHFLDI